MSDTDSDDIMLDARIEHVIRTSVDGLDPADREERIRWCQRTGHHGVRVHDDGPDGVRLMWGGRTLATVDRSVFQPDAMYADIAGAWTPDVPQDLTGIEDLP